jgi:hypothetical protein
MKYISLFVTTFLFYQCKPDAIIDPGALCLEFSAPIEWECEERMNYEFCFPSSYQSSVRYLIKSEPYSSLSKGVYNTEGQIVDVDNSNFIVSPFPDHII